MSTSTGCKHGVAGFCTRCGQAAEVESLKAEAAALRQRAEAAELDAALWEKSIKHTWSTVDVLHPPGVPGSYARGHHNGMCDALVTVRATRDSALDAQRKEQRT